MTFALFTQIHGRRETYIKTSEIVAFSARPSGTGTDIVLRDDAEFVSVEESPQMVLNKIAVFDGVEPC